MVAKQFPQNLPTEPNTPHEIASPARLLLFVIASVFIAELFVMLAFMVFPPMPDLLRAFLDALILVCLIFPALYYFLFQPMLSQTAERRQNLAALMKSNEFLERLFSISHILIAYMDTKFNFIRVNPAYAYADGQTPDFFPGKNHFELYPHDENEWIFQQVVEKGEPFMTYARPFVYAHAPERGITYWDWTLVPLKDPDGSISGVILSLVDVTERKKAEIALAESERRFRAIFNQTFQFICLLDPDGVVLEANQTILDFCAVGAQELVRRFIWEAPLWCPTGKCRKRMKLAVGRAAGGEFVRYEDDIRGGNHHTRTIDISFKPIFDEKGKVAFLIMEGHDITERKHAEEEVGRRNVELATLNAASLALSQSLDLNTVIHTLLEYIHNLVSFDSAKVIFMDDENTYSVRAIHGGDRGQEPGGDLGSKYEVEPGSPIHHLLSKQASLLIPDTRADPGWAPPPFTSQARSWLGAPLVSGRRVIGICSLEHSEAGFFEWEQLRLVEALTTQAASAVQNAWLFEQLRAGRERLQSLSRHLVEIQENERSYIARELHDEASQALSSLMVGLRILERDARQPEAVLTGVAELKHMVGQVLENLHQLAVELRPPSLDHLGLAAALRQHLEAISDRHGLTVQLETIGLDERLPKDMETALYRIVQEALANVVRHAQATRADVLLEMRAGKVIAMVEDNGSGFDPSTTTKSGRLGLLGIRERAEMLGGELIIECGESGGTTVLVEVPYGDTHPDRR